MQGVVGGKQMPPRMPNWVHGWVHGMSVCESTEVTPFVNSQVAYGAANRISRRHNVTQILPTALIIFLRFVARDVMGRDIHRNVRSGVRAMRDANDHWLSTSN